VILVARHFENRLAGFPVPSPRKPMLSRRAGLALSLVLALVLSADGGAARAEPPGNFATTPAIGRPAGVAPAMPVAAPSRSFAGDLAGALADTGYASRLASLGLDPVMLRDFYAVRANRALWVEDGGIAPAGAVLVTSLQTVSRGGLAAVAPAVARIEALGTASDATSLTELELLLSGTLAEAAFAAGEAMDAGTRLALLDRIDADDPAPAVATLLPAQRDFWALVQAFRSYSAIALAGGWPRVPDGPKLELGMRDPRVAALRERLVATDGEPALVTEPELFDAALESSVKRFQRRHGLGDDGVVGFKTIDALNMPVEDRLRSIAFNIRKLYDKRRDWGDRYIYVNIAAAELTYVDGGVVRTHVRTVVGRKDRETPELDSEINRLEFNPFWTVPPKIARVDLLPKIQANPRYFAEQNIRIYSSWSEAANEIDPDTIDWFSAEARAMRYRLKQDPGPENALGPVKLLFPNQYDVYIHGTTHQELFVKPARFFSSGCIRVKEPLDLAAMVLSDDPSWNRARIDATVAKGRNTPVKLLRPLPIHLDYRTAWVDAEGLLQLREDIYRRDKLPPKAVLAQNATADR